MNKKLWEGTFWKEHIGKSLTIVIIADIALVALTKNTQYNNKPSEPIHFCPFHKGYLHV